MLDMLLLTRHIGCAGHSAAMSKPPLGASCLLPSDVGKVTRQHKLVDIGKCRHAVNQWPAVYGRHDHLVSRGW